MALILHPEFQLYEKKDMPFCSSLQVAEEFSKRHQDVLRDIRALDCSDEFRKRNFARTSQTVDMPNGGTREEPIYLMARDGFMFLVMGYRGKKAPTIKEAIIKRFNDMEDFIKKSQVSLSLKAVPLSLVLLKLESATPLLTQNTFMK